MEIRKCPHGMVSFVHIVNSVNSLKNNDMWNDYTWDNYSSEFNWSGCNQLWATVRQEKKFDSSYQS